MSGHKEKGQIDPEADRGHHNLGFQGEGGDKIKMEDLDNEDNENIEEDDITRSNKENAEEWEAPKGNRLMQGFAKIRDYPFVVMSRHATIVSHAIKGIIFILYNIYLAFAIKYMVDQKMDFSDSMCHGFGFIVILTVIVYVGLVYYNILVPLLGETISKHLVGPLSKAWGKMFSYVIVQVVFGLAIIAALVTFIAIDAKDEPERLYSLLGVFVIIFIGFLFSAHPGHVKWRNVFWGVGLQFTMGLLVLRWDVGNSIFQCLGDKVAAFLGYTDAGSAFVYGELVDGAYLNSQAIRDYNWSEAMNLTETQVDRLALIADGLVAAHAFNPVFMFQTLSVIFFFSFFVSMLFYTGALQWLVMKMGWMLSVTIGTTAVESLNAAGNIFLGQTEAPLLIRPFIKDLTKSEIHAVMTGGFATIAGTVLAAFINMGIDPALLISASVMAAPAALGFSKLFYPETEKSKTGIENLKIEKVEAANILDAASQGASTAIMLVLNIGASLVAFLAFVEFVNQIIMYLAVLVGNDEVNLNYLIGKLFIPIAFIMGVPSEDVEEVAQLIGIKTVINEFAAYDKLGEWTRECSRPDLSPPWDPNCPYITFRSQNIASFALCGFANPSSIGIQLAGLGAMAPSRKKDLSEIVFRAFFAGVLTTCMNACVAGSLLSSK